MSNIQQLTKRHTRIYGMEYYKDHYKFAFINNDVLLQVHLLDKKWVLKFGLTFLLKLTPVNNSQGKKTEDRK